MQTNTDTRRSALKKLGLGTGAVYVAPAVTALVVPQHATATSSSATSSSVLTAPSSGDISAFLDGASGTSTSAGFLITSATDYSSQTISNLLVGGSSASITLQIFSRNITTIKFTAANNVSTGDSWSFTLLGTSYSGTI